jgi:hypothetical protein
MTASETSLGSKQATLSYMSGPTVLVIPEDIISVLTIPGLIFCKLQYKFKNKCTRIELQMDKFAEMYVLINYVLMLCKLCIFFRIYDYFFD